MTKRHDSGGTRVTLLLLIALIACLIVWGVVALKGVTTVRELFLENRELKEAISQLTREDQIGYAKVVRQETREGRLYTTLAFIETARDDKLEQILRKRYTIEGGGRALPVQRPPGEAPRREARPVLERHLGPRQRPG